MSNRGWLVTNPGTSRSKLLSESKSYIPPFWLSFLAPADVEAAEHPGQFVLDRKRAVARSASRVAFFEALFPEVRSFRAAAEALIQKVASQKCRTIGLEVSDLLEEVFDPALPGLAAAVGAIEDQNADYAVTLPARTLPNPFLPGKKVRRKALRIRSTQELLLQVCGVRPDDLTSGSREHVRESFIGYLWP